MVHRLGVVEVVEFEDAIDKQKLVAIDIIVSKRDEIVAVQTVNICHGLGQMVTNAQIGLGRVHKAVGLVGERLGIG